MEQLNDVVAVAMACVQIGCEDLRTASKEVLDFVDEHYIERRPDGLQRLADLPVTILSQVASGLGICFPVRGGRITIASEGGMNDGKEN